ncbi:MAG: DUF4150 domain-containing protein [Pseudomonadota bacterium]|nr:DUF4150 domain-containing protein [Pseudomonadota bacterium]
MSVLINNRTAVHAASQGVLTTQDVCKTPSKCKPVTYNNVAESKDAAQTASSVMAEENPVCHQESIFSRSTGDEAGSCGGVNSGTMGAEATFQTASNDVFIEGVPAVRQNEIMLSNHQNTPPGPLNQPGGSASPPPPAEVQDPETEQATADVFDLMVFGDTGRGLHGRFGQDPSEGGES